MRKRNTPPVESVRETPDRLGTSTTTDLGLMSVALLDANPSNPRREIQEKNVAELAASIREHGILDPLLVTAVGKRFLIVAGHRRLAAAKLLGLETVPCRAYVPGRDGVSVDAAAIVSNDQREPVDPHEEAVAVHELIGRGLTTAQAGQYLGRTEGWVRRRMGIRTLSRKVLDAEDLYVRDWPIAWLEDLSSIPTERQEKLLARDRLRFVRSRGDLQAVIFEESSDLAAAPWDVNDAELVEEAGSCVACPKRSSLSPGLFDEVEEKSERCLDRDCFAGKLKAYRASITVAARLKAGGPVVAVHGIEQGKGIRNGRALEKHDVTRVKAGTKGAKAAVVVDGANAGEVVYVKERGAKETPGTNGRAPKPEPMLEGLALVKHLALVRAVADVRACLSTIKVPSVDDLFVLLCAYPVEIGETRRTMGGGKRTESSRALARVPAACAPGAWRILREDLCAVELGGDSYWPKGSKRWAENVRAEAVEAEAVSDFFDARAPKSARPFDWKAILARAEKREAEAVRIAPKADAKALAKVKRKSGSRKGA